MFSKTKWTLYAAGLIVAVLMAVGLGGSVVLAQGPQPPTGRANWMQLYWDALAKRLGVTTDKLQQAMTDARKDALDQAVKQGLLTQAQADKMTQAGQNRAALVSTANARLDAATKTLGMSVDELKTAMRTKTLLTLAQEKKVDVTKLRTAIADAEKAAIDQAVKDGKLTQANADALKAKIKPENIDLNRPALRGQWAPGRAPNQQPMRPLDNRWQDWFKNRQPGQGQFNAPPFRR